MISLNDIVKEIKAKDISPEYWDFKGNDKREHVHSMIKYPAVMVPNMQGEIFDILLKYDNSIKNVLDPFMGSGTILVEGLLRGLNVQGVDINPLSYLSTVVKTEKYSLGSLKRKASELINRIDKDTSLDVFDFDNINKWYKKDVIISLSRIRRGIILEPELKYRRLFWLTFAEIAKQADNSRTSTFKLHIKEEETIKNWQYDCIAKFRFKLFENITAISDFQDLLPEKSYTTKIKYGDSLKILDDRRIFKDESVDLIITSPPYGDNATTITYGQFSVLPLKWIPLFDIHPSVSNSVIETLTKIDSDSLGGHNYTVSTIVESELFKFSASFNKLYNQLVNDMDFERIISLLQRVLKRKKYMVFTVGNRHVNKLEVPFDDILASIAEHYNFSVVYDFRRNILKNKNYTDNKAQNFKTIKKETVLVLQKE